MQALVVVEPLPIRTRLTVLQDETTASTPLVFCEARGCSVPLARCVTCPRGGAVQKDALGHDDAVECDTVSLAGTGHARGMAAVVATALPVGLAMARSVTCVAADLAVRRAAALVTIDPSSFGVPVVDRDGALLGLLPRASATLGVLGSTREVVGARMVGSTVVLREADSLDTAFREMCARRAREIVVVGATGQVVGLLRDVDAMRFVAYVTRTGTRPGRERAA